MAQVKDNVFVGLDIGTTKICAVVARKNMEDGIDIIGLGSAPSTGIRKGVVVNIDSTVKSIKDAVAAAERMSGVTVKSVFAGIAGGHIESFNSRGVVAVKSGEVTKNDVDRVLESASAINIPMGYEELHVIPQQFILDGQNEIKDPIGMSGVRLEVEVHIVTGAVSSAANITKSCAKAGIHVEDIVLEQLASSEAVLTDDEREIGVCLIDGGGGTTDMAVFNRGSVCHTAVLQIGGNNFTRDLTSALSTSEAEAERIKISNGCVMTDLVSPDETIEVASVGGRPPKIISKSVMTQVLQARAEEICELFLGELQKKKLFDLLSSGVVMTGGMSNFKGMEELASSVLGLNVRVGKPVNVGGLSDQVNNPIYATAVGLAKLHAKKGHSKNMISSGSEDGMFKKVGERMKEWMKEFF
ncbi:MAG: cell division protein FtsA [Deferribacterales bacterium]|nr:cell division protein FtsA [Deferribacterales bacterium]